MVSPCSVFLCCISLSFFNLSGVPSPWLLTTPIRTHSFVGVSPEDEDCTNSVEGGGKRWARVTHTCYIVVALSSGLIMGFDSC